MAKKKLKTKGQALVEFVLERYEYSKNEMAGIRSRWLEFYDDYRGTQLANKEPWQSNYIIPTLKDVVRTKVPLYANILFSNGLKSWDIEPGEEEDERIIPVLKDIMIYQLENCGKSRGGFLSVINEFLTQFEIYGYSVAKVPWRVEKDGNKVIFEGPDIECVDVFNFFPDPGTVDVNSSWCVVRKRDVFVSYLKQLEKQGIYHSISELKDTLQPYEAEDLVLSEEQKDRVELLEYHGDVPMDLLKGKITDESQVNPYDDEYVRAIITIANREVCIRNEPYPYECGNIFVDAHKDKMPGEAFGTGSAEDIQALAAELTNAHNKLSDCINLIANPMGIVNAAKVQGMSSGTVIAYPGKLFFAQPGVDNVANALQFIDTRAQASSLSPLITFIGMLEEKIQKVTQAVPVIAAMPSKKGLPETLGATLMMQGNAAEPIKHTVRHCLEPWFQKVLEIIYKHNLQFFSKATAYRVLGPEKAKFWEEEKERRSVRKEDIRLAGNPDFKPQGVSIFNEKQAEIENLINFLKISMSAVVPQVDAMGQPVIGEDGKPIMEPLVDQREIIKRIAEKLGFDDVEELIPSLKEEREKKEFAAHQQALMGAKEKATPGLPQQPFTQQRQPTQPAQVMPQGQPAQGQPSQGGQAILQAILGRAQ